ncbi:MAG TPA: Mov34/MPN/PAD-1 family protein [Thermoanaerobaculia bacterium]|nr:Mov34/MPN/PAD-1 family protein [Thermoanaerobaculia bacterium]
MNAAIASLLAVHLSLAAAVAAATCDRMTKDAAPHLRDLLRMSRTAARDTERAMFLTRDDDGGIGSVLWPRTMERRKATYRGSVPRNAIAIAHTHPHEMPKPSQHDLDEAARTGLPIYVVTRAAIYRVEPDRTVIEIAGRADWPTVVERGGEVCLA